MSGLSSTDLTAAACGDADMAAAPPVGAATEKARAHLETGDGASPRRFVLEVSAAQPDGVRDATDAPDSERRDDASGGARRPRWVRRRRARQAVRQREAGRRSLGDEDAQVGAELSFSPIDAVDEFETTEVDGDASLASWFKRRSRARAEEKALRRRGVPAWMTSVAAHACLLAMLMAVTLTVIEPTKELELTAAPELSELEEFPLADEVAPVEVDGHSELLADVVSDPLLDMTEASSGGIFAESPLDQLGAGADTGSGDQRAGRSAGGGVAGVGTLFGGDGLGTAPFGSGLGETPIAEFFGTKIEGKRIVFVLDNSGSMQDGRLETVIHELLRCVDSLERDQQFYVVFHSDAVYPLFYPDPIDRYISPTKAGKQALAEWLDSVELCLGDSVDEALAIAAMIRPDTVLLLSDGQIPSPKTLSFLMNGELRDFPVHTFAVGMGSSIAGRRNLQEIAAANGGEFREGETPEAMKELARERPRMYHDRLPGLVWGRNVRARR